jgi:hypothetical protein
MKEGGCHCGAIRFQISQPPLWVGACYCVDCRKISGAPYLVFAQYDSTDVHILQGTPKQYSSSKNVFRSFCENCGSPISYVYKNKADKIFIPIGVFDNPTDFVLQEHIWTLQKLPWITIHDNQPQKK